MASTYVAGGDLEYGRYGNPTWSAFEDALGALEGGRCLAFASGLAAVSTMLDLVGHGGKVVAPTHAYLGSIGQMADLEARGRIDAVLVDVPTPSRSSRPATTPPWCWIESPTNPALEVVDLPPIVEAAHAAGAYVVVDNTFATPLLQQPLSLGADLVLHSATKFIAGHSDVVLGAIVTADDQLHDVLKKRRDIVGATPGTFETWLALRGLRTLHVRLERAQANAAELVRRLGSTRPSSEVRYPGFGAIVSVVLAEGGDGGRPADPQDHAVGARHRRWAASSRPSSGDVAGRPSPPPSRTGWCGCRSASRTSTTCGTTWRRLSTTWSSRAEDAQSRSCLASLEISAVSISAAVISPSTTAVHGLDDRGVDVGGAGQVAQRAAGLHALGDLTGRGGDLLGRHPLAELLPEGRGCARAVRSRSPPGRPVRRAPSGSSGRRRTARRGERSRRVRG